MSYYILKPAVDTQETGNAYPAVESYDDYNFNAPNSVHKLKTHIPTTTKIDFRFKLAKNARPTDLLSQATIKGAGILVSEKLLNFLKKYETIQYQEFEVQLKAQEKFLSYKYIHFTWEDWSKYVNWKASTFKLFENFEFSSIEINSYAEYLNEVNKSEFLRISPDKITFFDFNYDILNHPFIGETLISDKLVEELDRLKNFTGIDLSISKF
jgi:hypothetical protein